MALTVSSASYEKVDLIFEHSISCIIDMVFAEPLCQQTTLKTAKIHALVVDI